MTAPVLAQIVGQPRAVQLLDASIGTPVHAYLFVGPPGSGKREAAVAFAAALAISSGSPVIEPDRSMTSAMATSGSSRRFSAGPTCT